MATKLFPPTIEGKLPAFAGRTLKIPFTQNRSVSMSEVAAMSVVIKTVQTNTIIVDNLQGSYSYNDATGQYDASFQIDELYSSTPAIRKISPGQFYKVQLAYITKDQHNTVGYYSSVGVIKCTTAPTLEIPTLNHNYFGASEYTGYYSQSGENQDGSEKVYSYQFYLRDPEGNVIATSGEQVHDNSQDRSTTSSSDTWSINQALQDGIPYYLSYKITTMNGLVAETQGYAIIQSESIDPNLPCKLIATPIFEDGCVSLHLRPTHSKAINGSFVLSRASSEDNYSTWNEIYCFSYKNVQMTPRAADTHPSKWNVNDVKIWEDFTTKQGVYYIYSLQAYNAKGLYSSRILNMEEFLDESYTENPDRLGQYHTVFKHSPIFMDFEDAFLFDGKRQLRIRFNPKISSFKSTILESKIDTIGGKYPFIFRNGNVEYKEFPISGLLSLISDPNERFFAGIQKNLYISREEATLSNSDNSYELDSWLTADNLRREREFKMAALQWLTNGEPKLFRSPTEGNFIVRLLNTSLTPNDTVGRMLHSFSCTAYEIADYSFANLKYYKFITSPFGDNRDLKVAQIRLADIPPEFAIVNGLITLPDAYFANITEATPGTLIGFDFVDGTNLNEVEIGGTGCYYVPFKTDKALKYIKLLGNPSNPGSWDGAKLTYCYYDNAPTDNFSIVSDITVRDEVRQFIGTGYPNVAEDRDRLNVITNLSDIRVQVGKFHFIKVTKRPTWVCYQQTANTFSIDPEGKDILSGSDWNATVIYEVHDPNTKALKGYMYGTSKTLKAAKPDYRFSFNGSSIIDMEGNPNALDTFVCQVCHEIGHQEKFYQYDEDGNLIVDMAGEPLLSCPHYHSNRNSIYQLPSTQGRIEGLTNIDNVESLYIGSGVLVDAAFRIKEIEYGLEETDPEVKTAKGNWIISKEAWQEAISTGQNETIIANRKAAMDQNYNTYVLELESALRDAGAL